MVPGQGKAMSRISNKFNFMQLLLLAALIVLWPAANALANASGTFVYTKRFDGDSVVLEVDWTYIKATPSLTFGTPRVIWSGARAPDGGSGFRRVIL